MHKGQNKVRCHRLEAALAAGVGNYFSIHLVHGQYGLGNSLELPRELIGILK